MTSQQLHWTSVAAHIQYMCPVRVLFWATQNHLFWGSAIKPDLITSWWWVLQSVAASLSQRLSSVCGNGERGGDMPALPSASPGLFVCALVAWRAARWGRRDGQSQWSAVQSRLWLMNRGALPSHWAEFTSSHNHLSLFFQLVSPSSIYVFISFCLLLFLCLSFPPIC